MALGHHSHSGIDINSTNNQNPDPITPIYPQLSRRDAPYQFQESTLRSAIFIPSEFYQSKDTKFPVLLVPGTGSYGGSAFSHNIGKLLSASNFATPVWLNIPGAMCDDATKNAEYVAYGINYISKICSGSRIAVIAWSQGNLSVQWSLKYWPSTRQHVNNFICLCADFKGTMMAWLVAPKEGVACAPAVRQQKRRSRFVETLSSNGGDSAYVPTTSIYSRTDEVVQPQFGKGASARMGDERGVGVLNCEVQVVACGKPAGLIYTHFTLMFNPLAWALIEDAIRNGGPGRLDRIDMKCCKHTKAPGLSLVDAAKTQALSLTCAKAILNFRPKLKQEPVLSAYCWQEEMTFF